MVITIRPASSSDTSTRAAIASAIIHAKRIVVLSGAGISCSCGIPDFRSSDGLYDLVKQRYPDIFVKGHELFDASVFRDPLLTAAFYTFIAQLKQRIDRSAPSPTHKFLKTLDTKKKLLRSYTQNIDGFEERVGLLGSSSDDARVAYSNGRSKFRGRDVRSILLHGDIHRVRCTLCSTDLPCTLDHIGMFDKGVAPDCVECKARADARVAANKRSIKVGVLRPAIVLYNEPHPLGDEIGAIQAVDIGKKPDLLLIMGTSLKVPGFKKTVKSFADVVHARMGRPATRASLACAVIFVNQTAPTSEWKDIIDYHVQCSTDEWVEEVMEQWKSERPADWDAEGVSNGVGGRGGQVTKTDEIGKNEQAIQEAEGENIPPSRSGVDASLPLSQKPNSASAKPSTHFLYARSNPSNRSPKSNVLQHHNADDAPRPRMTLDSPAKSVNDCDVDADDPAAHISNPVSTIQQLAVAPMAKQGGSLRSRLETPMMPPPPPPPLRRRLLPPRLLNAHDRLHEYN